MLSPVNNNNCISWEPIVPCSCSAGQEISVSERHSAASRLQMCCGLILVSDVLRSQPMQSGPQSLLVCLDFCKPYDVGQRTLQLLPKRMSQWLRGEVRYYTHIRIQVSMFASLSFCGQSIRHSFFMQSCPPPVASYYRLARARNVCGHRPERGGEGTRYCQPAVTPYPPLYAPIHPCGIAASPGPAGTGKRSKRCAYLFFCCNLGNCILNFRFQIRFAEKSFS
mmetsp:Transcript_6757/g.12753  ORF Transcript_6757/g.12753 Transcript_6757/m.12753 type:complete len:223 (-) Transcript_6757:288-956(-)